MLALPAVFVCENNFYGEFTPMEAVTAGGEIAARAGAYGIPFDGRRRQRRLGGPRGRQRGRSSAPAPASGPTLLECQTYRHFGHSKSDPARLPARRASSSSGRQRDPLTLTRERLLADGVAEDELAAVETRREEGSGRRPRRRSRRPIPIPRSGPGRSSPVMSELEFRVAIRDAIAEELDRDEAVVFFGEDVAAEQGGVFAVTPGLQERFGAERVFDTPISELALAGAAFGAAVTGMRPIIEIMFGDFMALPMDSLVNQAAKLWYVSNEQGARPLVVRSAVGAGGRFGAMHSQTHGHLVPGDPRDQGRRTLLARRREGAAEGARSATTTR